MTSLKNEFGGIQFKGTIASGVLTVTEGSQRIDPLYDISPAGLWQRHGYWRIGGGGLDA